MSGSDKRTLVALAMLLPCVDIALRTAGLKRTQRWLLGPSRPISGMGYSSVDIAHAHRLAELAAIAGANGFYRTTCLRQALIVQYWLHRRGLPVRLRIGALKNVDGTANAHAWVELDGVALAQPALCHGSFPGLDDLLH